MSGPWGTDSLRASPRGSFSQAVCLRRHGHQGLPGTCELMKTWLHFKLVGPDTCESLWPCPSLGSNCLCLAGVRIPGGRVQVVSWAYTFCLHEGSESFPILSENVFQTSKCVGFFFSTIMLYPKLWSPIPVCSLWLCRRCGCTQLLRVTALWLFVSCTDKSSRDLSVYWYF